MEDIRAKVAYYGLAEVMLEVKVFLKIGSKKVKKRIDDVARIHALQIHDLNKYDKALSSKEEHSIFLDEYHRMSGLPHLISRCLIEKEYHEFKALLEAYLGGEIRKMDENKHSKIAKQLEKL
jgi:hypothetical protein